MNNTVTVVYDVDEDSRRKSQAKRWMLKGLIYLDQAQDRPKEFEGKPLLDEKDQNIMDAQHCIEEACAAISGKSFEVFDLR